MPQLQPTHEQVGSLVPKEVTTPPSFQIDKELKDACVQLFTKCEKLNDSDWLRVKQQMVRARNYFEGNQFGEVSPSCQWFDYQVKSGEVHYTANVYQHHVQTALMEISKGKTRLSFSHVTPDSRYGALVAKIAESRYNTHRKRLFGTIKESQEKLSALLNGIAARYTYFKYQKSDKMPVFGEKDVEGMSSQVCAICSAPSNGQCKECGSDEVKPLEQQAYKSKAVTGYEDKYCGENAFDSVDPMGLLFYMNAQTVKDTPYVIWKQVVLKDVLQSQYPDAQIKEGITAVELNYQAHTRTPNTNFEALVGDADKATSQLDQGWFDLPLYQNIIVKTNTTLRNGVTIMAGTKLGQVFPNGLFIAKNGDNILDLWSENKNDKWTIAPYVMRLGTMVGGGTSIALEAQDIKNDLMNLFMASITNDSFRKEFVNGQFLEPENIPNNPMERAVVTNLPEGGKIVGTAIDVLPPTGLSPDAFAMDEKADGLMQGQMGTFSGTPIGMPDVKAVQNTAAGMQMWREMTTNRFWPMLSVMADALDKEQAYQFLENDKRYLTPKQWEKYKGEYGAEAVQAFMNCNLREDLCIEVVDGSYMPTTDSQKRADVVEYATIMANLAGAGISLETEMGAEIADRFSLPKTLVSFDKYYSMAEGYIVKLKAEADSIVEQLGDIPSFDIQTDAMALDIAYLIITESGVEISSVMDNSEAMVAAMKDWWVKDEGRNASNCLKAAIILLTMGLEQKGVEKVRRDLMLSMQAQQPLMEQQMAMQSQQAEQEAQANQQNAEVERENLEMQNQAAETQMMADAAGKVMETEAAESQRSHEMEMADREDARAESQRQHDLAMKDKDIEMAKSKPKKITK